ncbi:MAG: DNA repair protein [Clostridia bacterium]|nr:DNA repair protein [Clostridia bacterium]MBQ7363964.1 DNA repair protein [Clostridia bacterium]
MSDRVYACIDLRSFYASVECVERGLDPLTARLAVADPERERGTICLAITPAMKKMGIKNRCRIFEIPTGIDYIKAKPRMKLYMERSAEIYSIYLRYISPDDIHVYSIDECFIDLTPYVKLYGKTPKELTRMLMLTVLSETGIPSCAGVGTNLFLAKVALDILAKGSKDGIAELDEDSFSRTVAHHRPITDIWNIGEGTAGRLRRMGVYDLHGITRIDGKYLKEAFGVDAELLIDHANGRESCTIADIKKYRPRESSISHSQVLFRPYSRDDARLILSEMIEVSVLEMIEKSLACTSISLRIGYNYSGRYGTSSFSLPPPTGGSMKLKGRTNSLRLLTEHFMAIYNKHTRDDVMIKNIGICLGGLVDEKYVDIDMFTDVAALDREHSLLSAIVEIKEKYGKNAIVKGSAFEPASTAIARNSMVGGHNG